MSNEHTFSVDYSCLICLLSSIRERSIELKRSMSCPDPDIGCGLKSSPVVPHNTPLSSARPFQDWDNSEYPCLPSHTSSTPIQEATSPNVFTYADALGPRVAKRTMADRTCLSPIDYLPKRSALSNTISGHQGSGTQLSPTVTTKISEDQMDIGTTPDNDR